MAELLFGDAVLRAAMGNLVAYLICRWIRVKARRLGAAEQKLWLEYCARQREYNAKKLVAAGVALCTRCKLRAAEAGGSMCEWCGI